MKCFTLSILISFSCAIVSGQGDPTPDTPPAEIPQNPPPTWQYNPPQTVTKQNTTPAQSRASSPAKSHYTRVGIYTWRPQEVAPSPGVMVQRKGIPTIYYSGGRDLAKIITFNVEMMINWTQFEITSSAQQTETVTKSNYISAGIGAQMEIKLPLFPTGTIEPYGQGSVGGMYQLINNSIKSLNSSYSINLPGYYYSFGGGLIFYLKEDFGVFAEGGQMWHRSIETQVDIIDRILEKQGVTGVSSEDYGTPNEPYKWNDPYFKVGAVFKIPLR